jgi:hypothetical protein
MFIIPLCCLQLLMNENSGIIDIKIAVASSPFKIQQYNNMRYLCWTVFNSFTMGSSGFVFSSRRALILRRWLVYISTVYFSWFLYDKLPDLPIPKKYQRRWQSTHLLWVLNKISRDFCMRTLVIKHRFKFYWGWLKIAVIIIVLYKFVKTLSQKL